MCNILHLQDKHSEKPAPTHEQREGKSERMFLSHGKDHLDLLATPFSPGLLIDTFFHLIVRDIKIL